MTQGDGSSIITIRDDYVSVESSGEVTFDYLNNSGLYTIGTGEYEFQTRWSSSNSDTIYDNS